MISIAVKQLAGKHEKIDAEALDIIIELVHRECKVDFAQYRKATIMRRIYLRASKIRCPDLQSYASYLQNNPAEIRELFKFCLIGVTAFFRDKKTFLALKKKILPKILRDMNEETKLRIWVPGCSTGEGAHSIGICLLELLKAKDCWPDTQIYATDINESAIAKARAGVYTQR